jgi:hypothetical protein
VPWQDHLIMHYFQCCYQLRKKNKTSTIVIKTLLCFMKPVTENYTCTSTVEFIKFILLYCTIL